MTDLIDVVVLITPNGDWGAVRLYEGEQTAEVSKLMLEAWEASVSYDERQEIGDNGPTVVLQKMTAEGYHRVSARLDHWLRSL